MSVDDRKSFPALWTQVHAVVAAYISSSIGNQADADDLLQETAITADRRFADFDQSRDFAAWCIGIARNLLRNHCRKAHRRPQVLDDDVLAYLADAAEQENASLKRYAARLEHCLSRLNERARRLIHRFYHDDIPQEQLAFDEGMSHAGVRTAIHRTRLQLRQCIEGSSDE